MDFITLLDDTSANTERFRSAHPEAAKGFTGMHRAAMANGALTTKDKELQCIAIGIAKQCNDCIGFHVRAALKAGATRDEVAETVSVAIMMGGGPAYMYGARALRAFDQLSQ
ncbi:alkyl hydroperoxide reductase AhpD [Aliiroseovarius zhejiangensis]|uniref:Alkyl hydroperoxide reductase AhpD n=1 Tax=Aliiroseovarius zhejiangensis TaxID=1632025 RepID=A0ABQ3IKB4_9RHOB|nr:MULTISPECIES: carboxymuconolactone decarboxylase family protein [Aliiroseovarius]MCK8483841.1 carboxymuconolactone decarboxylase family protein [Aliiroseovarius sp. S2029]GHE86337.1 alkyl hydroperoxide reductase AhpD [Aliiroseovarius zhejiangensis]